MPAFWLRASRLLLPVPPESRFLWPWPWLESRAPFAASFGAKLLFKEATMKQLHCPNLPMADVLEIQLEAQR